MQLTKFTHACVRLDSGGRRLLIDPGIWAEDAAFEGVTDVIVTHEHFDHLDVDRLSAAARRDSALTVHATAAVVGKLAALGDAAVVVVPGDTFSAGGFSVSVVGGEHAEVYDGQPGIANVGFVVDAEVYHPGDSFFVPDVPVGTLLVPTAAPWLKLAEAIDFVRAVGPRRAHSIHDAMLNDRGTPVVDRLLDLNGGTDYSRITVGSTVEV